jgi:hypothetical protein
MKRTITVSKEVNVVEGPDGGRDSERVGPWNHCVVVGKDHTDVSLCIYYNGQTNRIELDLEFNRKVPTANGEAYGCFIEGTDVYDFLLAGMATLVVEPRKK